MLYGGVAAGAVAASSWRVQYAQVVASENPDLIKCFVEKMPLPPHLEGNAIALQLVDYAQVQKKQWTVETGNQ